MGQKNRVSFRVQEGEKLEKVYFTPQPMGVGTHHSTTYEMDFLRPELSKTGQITPLSSFEKS
jgi:hypothetical protein